MTPSGKRDRITSADPEWPEVERLHAEYGRITAQAEQTLEELRRVVVLYLEARDLLGSSSEEAL